MAPEQFFANYTKRVSLLPQAVWQALRVITLLGTLGFAALLALQPQLGLKLWWGFAIPVVPLLLIIVPGLWRQICPMAFLNQIPRMTGTSRAKPLPAKLKNASFVIAVTIFLVCVALRAPLLNHEGALVALVIVAVLLIALAGGFVFAGRSGWCGTFCPLGPVQKVYGQAPLVVVKNGYCDTCVGCQKNCYDFNPRGAFYADLDDADPRHAAQRRLFYGILPGLILGYFLQGPAQPADLPAYWATLFAACAAAAGLYAIATSYLPFTPQKVAAGFAAAALAMFYWFAGPIIVKTVSDLAGTAPPEWAIWFARSLGAVGALTLFMASLYSQIQFKLAKAAPAPAATGHTIRKTQMKTRFGGGAEVTDRESKVTFPVAKSATLLDAIEGAGLKINFGCRAGVCGADAVAICSGAKNLSPAGDEELATLRRMGLEGKARLACMCQVKGPVVIDRDPHSPHAAGSDAAPAAPAVDHAQGTGVGKVVIIGNGVAGTSAAEQLRRLSPSVQIDIITNEPLHFYNRMAIGRLIYGRTGMDGLQLIPDNWYTSQKVEVWRNSIAQSVDRQAKSVTLATGERLAYDKLILATGAHCSVPSPDFLDHSNAFVLRTADDAQALRNYIQLTRARRAVVIGGGVLGVEAADALHHLGLEVTILQRADRLMNAQLDREGAAKLTAYLEGIGIQVVPDASISKWEASTGESRVLKTAWLAHGPRVRADVYVAALGISANLGLAKVAGLEVGRGIKVDTTLRTADPDIYAVGDVAELPGNPAGLWAIGAAQAAAAAHAIFGKEEAYKPPRIVLQLKCDGIDLRSFGEISAKPGDEEFTAHPEDPAWWRIILRQDVLVGALYVGPPRSAGPFTKAVQNNLDLTPIKKYLARGDLTRMGMLEGA